MSFGLQTSVASILFYKKKSMKKFTTMLACCFFAVSIFAQIEMIKPEGLKMGDTAPDINAMDQDGKKVQLKELLKKGDVVVIFYRGQWCPYCSKQLSKVNDSLSLSFFPTGILSGLISMSSRMFPSFFLAIHTGLLAAAICSFLFSKSNISKLQSIPSLPPSALPSFFNRSIMFKRV